MSGAWLVLPTYNEAENIEPIVRAALPQLASTGREHRVLVVDDDSPDGTGEIADRLAARASSEVEVLHRAAQGGHRARLPRGVRARARRRGGPGAGDGLGLLARPRATSRA